MAGRAHDAGFRALMSTVGANLHSLRRDREMTQAALAEVLDIAVEHLRGIEGGYRAPSLRLLHSASTCLDVDIKVFFAPTRKPNRNPGRPPRSS